jgi:hypothetical protein
MAVALVDCRRGSSGCGLSLGTLLWQTRGPASFDSDTREPYNIEEDFLLANDLTQEEAEAGPWPSLRAPAAGALTGCAYM